MSDQAKAALRSFITTFVAVFAPAIPAAKIADGDFTWVTAAAAAALAAAVTAALRTLLAALDPGQPLYGKRRG